MTSRPGLRQQKGGLLQQLWQGLGVVEKCRDVVGMVFWCFDTCPPPNNCPKANWQRLVVWGATALWAVAFAGAGAAGLFARWFWGQGAAKMPKSSSFEISG